MVNLFVTYPKVLGVLSVISHISVQIVAGTTVFCILFYILLYTANVYYKVFYILHNER